MSLSLEHRRAGRSHAPRPCAIEPVELEKTYRGGTRALNGVSVFVPAGGIFALLGPNGAGNSTSTAVKLLTTLSRADAGESRVTGNRRFVASRPQGAHS